MNRSDIADRFPNRLRRMLSVGVLVLAVGASVTGCGTSAPSKASHDAAIAPVPAASLASASAASAAQSAAGAASSAAASHAASAAAKAAAASKSAAAAKAAAAAKSAAATKKAAAQRQRVLAAQRAAAAAAAKAAEAQRSAEASRAAAQPTPTPTAKAASNCTPGYSPCIEPGPDVDCAGGSGNGPRYVNGPVSVTGPDIYDLDRDGDGVGCQ